MFEKYDLDELMGQVSVRDIKAFIAAHEDELFEADYLAILERELAKKRQRKRVVTMRRAAIGEGYAS